MKARFVKYSVVLLGFWCVVAASDSCYIKQIPPPVVDESKLHKLSDLASSGQCNSYEDDDDDFSVSDFLVYFWNDFTSKIATYWVAIAMCSLLPLIALLENMAQRLQDWNEPFDPKEKEDTQFRRPTLPDLTLARHARRESLAESAQNHTNRPATMSQSNIPKNEEPGDSKRVHIIRRRH